MSRKDFSKCTALGVPDSAFEDSFLLMLHFSIQETPAQLSHAMVHYTELHGRHCFSVWGLHWAHCGVGRGEVGLGAWAGVGYHVLPVTK